MFATFVSSLKALAEWFGGREYARISGLLMAMGGIGWLSAATPLALLTETLGWRCAFVIIGIITAFLAILTWFTVVDKPDSNNTTSINSKEKEPEYNLRASLSYIIRQKHFGLSWSGFSSRKEHFSVFSRYGQAPTSLIPTIFPNLLPGMSFP